MKHQKALDMTEDSELSVAIPDTPLSDWQELSIKVILEEKVMLVHSKFRLHPESEKYCWCV